MVARQKKSGERRPTIRDVAALAGVSTATVSHVLNGKSRAGAKARDAVLDAVKALDFRRNGNAASLRTQRSKLVGLVIPTLTNAFFARMSSEFEKQAYDHGYEMAVIASDEDPVMERDRILALLSRQLDGLIVYPSSDVTVGNGLDARLLPPTVLMDRGLNIAGFDTVGLKNELAGQVVAHELLAQGHIRIGVLLPSLDLASSRDRADGIASVVAKHSVSSECRVIVGGYSIDGARSAIEQELRRQDRITAIVAATNVTTLGAIKAIQGLHLRMPEDISLIGFDDFEWMTALRPYVSAVAQPFESLASTGWNLLLKRMTGQAQTFQHVLLEGELRIRESSGRAPA
jgi:LacI family transcriptional regulator